MLRRDDGQDANQGRRHGTRVRRGEGGRMKIRSKVKAGIVSPRDPQSGLPT
jgi:hypothetical protein